MIELLGLLVADALELGVDAGLDFEVGGTSAGGVGLKGWSQRPARDVSRDIEWCGSRTSGFLCRESRTDWLKLTGASLGSSLANCMPQAAAIGARREDVRVEEMLLRFGASAAHWCWDDEVRNGQ